MATSFDKSSNESNDAAGSPLKSSTTSAGKENRAVFFSPTKVRTPLTKKTTVPFRDTTITKYELIPRPVDDVTQEYTDTRLSTNLVSLFRAGKNGKGWEINYGPGELSYFEQRNDPERKWHGRIKYVQNGTNQIHLHAYIHHNTPSPVPHEQDKDKSRVIHVWSSTGDLNRTMFLLKFEFKSDADAFDERFSRTIELLAKERDHAIQVRTNKKRKWKKENPAFESQDFADPEDEELNDYDDYLDETQTFADSFMNLRKE